ncbi:hypothetical protein N7466_002411 [Penicillium verhagenii]|uniref:uncharacterized protein n=1 Tax=Penicillium verhagenii TaxID=1562060 RepID=UPI002544EA28|nr:uncharacterized protein N7466_002411 [Penicillium verhagenii]KAJ5939277.1 hypothetical protein N7466_002411 [Penicillium verhagenii]
MSNSTAHWSIGLSLPSRDIFKLPPSQPQTGGSYLRAPPSNIDAPNYFYPFRINNAIFQASIDLTFALTFSVAYVTTVMFLNQYNASRQYRPWAISRILPYKIFVFVHNSLLALFSAWVLVGFAYASYTHLPTADGKHDYYARVAEYLCQSESESFRREFKNLLRLGSISTGLKGFSEQGTGYFGCIFYFSKYYEVVDTLIILAGGKRSSTLQTYHHAGVILCGWSAIRFNSPIGLIGLILNATVHTLMYTYFAIQRLGIRVPMGIKRSLTGIQIAQFLVGMVWSMCYLFVTYRVPSTTADNHDKESAQTFEPHASRVHSFMDSNHTMVPCITDSGEANVLFVTNLYLLPLIYLFVQFFIRSYRKEKKRKY